MIETEIERERESTPLELCVTHRQTAGSSTSALDDCCSGGLGPEQVERLENRMSLLSAQESLRKITHTLALKNEEISNFVSTLKQNLDNLEVIGDAGNATPCRVPVVSFADVIPSH